MDSRRAVGGSLLLYGENGWIWEKKCAMVPHSSGAHEMIKSWGVRKFITGWQGEQIVRTIESMMKSCSSIDVPTIKAKPNDLNKMVTFIYSYEQDLRKYGALKIEQNDRCKHALKKRQKPTYSVVKRQTVTRSSHSNDIFLVQTQPCPSVLTCDKSVPTDADEFWKSVCQTFDEENEQPNISNYPGKSFYSKQGHHDGFNMYRIPSQSLLQVGGKKVTNQFVPTLVQTYRAGAVFPLSTACQCLLSLHYLHQGATRHWYVIPADERPSLEKILMERNIPICFNHQSLLFEPDFLDTHSIQYFRITQDPGQFVVLEAGTLAQSYCTGASWSETIDFALPSWLECDRVHSYTASCACNKKHHRILSPIDVALFRSELVNRYITTYLKRVLDDDPSSPTDGNSIITACNNLTTTEQSTSTNSPSELSNSHNTASDSLCQRSVRIVVAPLINYDLPYEYDRHATKDPMIMDENNQIPSTRPNDEIWYQRSAVELTDIDENRMNNDRIDTPSISLDEFFNFIPNRTISVQSTYMQTDEPAIMETTEQNPHDVSPAFNQSMQSHRFLQQQQTERNKPNSITIDNRKTLYVSNLKYDVSKHDLKHHFIGSIKVILKQHKNLPSLKYALVIHRTTLQAEKNEKRPMDHQLFGSDCRVEFAKNPRETSIPYNIAVTCIPEDVTESELRKIFIDCDALKYCPARSVQKSIGTDTSVHQNKILRGYAFLYYSDTCKATKIIERNGQYIIRNQSLVVSFRTKKP